MLIVIRKYEKVKIKKKEYINSRRHYSVPFMFLPNNTIMSIEPPVSWSTCVFGIFFFLNILYFKLFINIRDVW
jgi:hypothetical protein